MPLWHKDYFELKAIKTLKTQEKLLIILLNDLKEFRQVACTRKRAITRDNSFKWEIYQHGLANISLPKISSSHLPVNYLLPL